MKVILLAAGMGKRLGTATEILSKAMVSVLGQPLIDYTLQQLISHPNVEQVLVIGGFAYNLLHDHLNKNFLNHPKICLLNNTQFHLANIFSVLTAENKIGESNFVLTNVDHLFPKDGWDFILQERSQLTVFCDFDRVFLEDEMKVQWNDGGKIWMDKKLTAYQAAYDGVTFIPKIYQQKYWQAAHAVVKRFGDGAVVEQIVNQLAEQGEKFLIEKMDAYKWFEVDTMEDLAKAEEQLKQKKQFY